MTSSYLYVILGGTLWGFIGIFVRLLAQSGLNPMEVVTVRSTGAALLFALFLLTMNRKLLPIKLQDLWIFLGGGFLSLAGFNYCNFTCITLSTLATAALLMYTAPAFVLIFSVIFFREQLTIPKIAALLLTLAGCTLVTGVIEEGLSLNWSIVGFGLASGIGYALYSIFSKLAVLKGYHPATIAMYNFGFCALPAIFTTGGIPLNKLTGEGWLGLWGIVFICSLAANFLYTKGLTGIDAGSASILATVEPFVASLTGVLIYGEILSPTKIMGMLLIFSSIILLNRQK